MCEQTQPPTTRTHSHPYVYIKTYNYTQLQDYVLSEIDRVTEDSVDDGHVVLTIVAPREEATEIYFGENPGGNHAPSGARTTV
jgi:hypothetical protein